MWKDSDFRELFQNYNPEPPQKVWEQISYALYNERAAKTISPFFTTTQKMTLAAASVASIFLSAFMYRYIDTNMEIKTPYAEVISNIPSQEAPLSYKTELVVLENKLQTSIKTASFSSITKKKVAPQIQIPEEFGEFKKEIQELAELDRQIAILEEEITAVKSRQTVNNTWESPQLVTIESITERKTATNWTRYKELEKEAKTEIPTLALNPEAQTKKEDPKWSFLDKFYLTPYLGTNYTQVTYRDRPTNDYFSEKANFSGRLGYNVGIQLGYQLSKRWSIESGIGLGQYILGFREDHSTYDRNGDMYIDQLDIPLMARYSIPFGSKDLPLAISVKGGVLYSNVIFYQVNYIDRQNRPLPIGPKDQYFSVDVDKRQYNSMQLGYTAGFDFDAYFSKKIALNLSVLNALVSQSRNFPLFNAEKQRPIQFSTSFSIGTKIRF